MADDPSGLPIRLEKMITRQRGSSMGSVSYRMNGGEDGYERKVSTVLMDVFHRDGLIHTEHMIGNIKGAILVTIR